MQVINEKIVQISSAISLLTKELADLKEQVKEQQEADWVTIEPSSTEDEALTVASSTEDAPNMVLSKLTPDTPITERIFGVITDPPPSALKDYFTPTSINNKQVYIQTDQTLIAWNEHAYVLNYAHGNNYYMKVYSTSTQEILDKRVFPCYIKQAFMLHQTIVYRTSTIRAYHIPIQKFYESDAQSVVNMYPCGNNILLVTKHGSLEILNDKLELMGEKVTLDFDEIQRTTYCPQTRQLAIFGENNQASTLALVQISPTIATKMQIRFPTPEDAKFTQNGNYIVGTSGKQLWVLNIHTQERTNTRVAQGVSIDKVFMTPEYVIAHQHLRGKYDMYELTNK